MTLAHSWNRTITAPSRWLDRFARWKLGPPTRLSKITCSTCGRKVNVWRRYADDRLECIPCAEGIR